MSTTRMPVRPLIEKVAADGDRHQSGKVGADRLDRKVDIGLGAVVTLCAGMPGRRESADGFQLAERQHPRGDARLQLRRLAGQATKVPVDWSLAIFCASASVLPGVSMR